MDNDTKLAVNYVFHWLSMVYDKNHPDYETALQAALLSSPVMCSLAEAMNYYTKHPDVARRKVELTLRNNDD